MFELHTLASLDSPELEPYRTMRWQARQRELGVFVAEGEKVVRRLLESDLTVVSVLMPPDWLEELRSTLERRPERIDVYVAPKEHMENLIGYSMYQGLLALARVPPLPSLRAALQAAPTPQLLVAVDGVNNAENLGALVRSCVAFGAHALLVGETSGSPFLRRAVRASMGAVFRFPIVELHSLREALLELRKCGIRTLAAHPRPNQRPPSQADLKAGCCMVFGSEGVGISPSILEVCDEAVAVPMRRGVDSLNVASASAVFLYEAARQRGEV